MVLFWADLYSFCLVLKIIFSGISTLFDSDSGDRKDKGESEGMTCSKGSELNPRRHGNNVLYMLYMVS